MCPEVLANFVDEQKLKLIKFDKVDIMNDAAWTNYKDIQLKGYFKTMMKDQKHVSFVLKILDVGVAS
jgi:hypothetical protein